MGETDVRDMWVAEIRSRIGHHEMTADDFQQLMNSEDGEDFAGLLAVCDEAPAHVREWAKSVLARTGGTTPILFPVESAQREDDEIEPDLPPRLAVADPGPNIKPGPLGARSMCFDLGIEPLGQRGRPMDGR